MTAACSRRQTPLHRRAFATVPEYFGKPSHYTEGTGFLGVPENNRDVSSCRRIILDTNLVSCDLRHVNQILFECVFMLVGANVHEGQH
jgi:hypothetical protein